MSIATKLGDNGQTGLIGGKRISKADLRVEAYGTVDELNSALGLARSVCPDHELRDWTEAIQRSLFRVGAALATPPESRKGPPAFTTADLDLATEIVEQIEARDGILADWSLPGARMDSAAFDLARTVCRRAERCAVRLHESGEHVPPEVLAYLNRLSDLFWLFGRVLDLRAGVDTRLRDDETQDPNWSRAW